jgi:hypothetical protein
MPSEGVEYRPTGDTCCPNKNVGYHLGVATTTSPAVDPPTNVIHVQPTSLEETSPKLFQHGPDTRNVNDVNADTWGDTQRIPQLHHTVGQR